MFLWLLIVVKGDEEEEEEEDGDDLHGDDPEKRSHTHTCVACVKEY